MATIGLASPALATFPSRHNGLIAFRGVISGVSGSQIYTIRPNGHDLRQLTHLTGGTAKPHWSPDGRRIVFEFDPPSGCGSVDLMNRDGTHLVDLTTEPKVCEAAPSFTPDGSHIVFERFDPATNVDAIWSMNLSGGDLHEITAGIGDGVTNPEVSPNGELLSFVAYNDTPNGAALYTAYIDGTHLLRLVPFSLEVGVKEDWAPDGRHIVFNTYANNNIPGISPNIATIRPDGTHLEYLTHYTGGQLGANVGSYSPNARWILFRIRETPQGPYALYRMNTGGGALHAIIPYSSLFPGGSDWGPAEH
jgi:Tol biopolymer transport system component